MMESYRYLFGPVPSRRLGRSLGVDLIPRKTCTMDCVFCQLGGTPCATAERGLYAPIDEVLGELEQWSAAGGTADHITLAGSGEPTLHLQFGEVLHRVKQQARTPSVLLTNGSLLHLPEVRADAALADKVKVTLSAWDEASFRQIHRPAQGITFDRLVEGERAFRQQFGGELSVEVFIVDGVNSSIEQVRKIACWVESVEPDRIDLNTAVRPPAETGVRAVSPHRLRELAAVFGPKAVVAPASSLYEKAASDLTPEDALAMIRRHPVTVDDVTRHCGMPAETISDMLEQLVAEGRIRAESRGGSIYYTDAGAE